MATSDSTAPDVAQSAVSPARPRDELDDALCGLQRAISLVKVATAAPVGEVDPAQHEQAMELVIDQLDEAYNAMDRAIVHVGPDRAGSAVERTSPRRRKEGWLGSFGQISGRDKWTTLLS